MLRKHFCVWCDAHVHLRLPTTRDATSATLGRKSLAQDVLILSTGPSGAGEALLLLLSIGKAGRVLGCSKCRRRRKRGSNEWRGLCLRTCRVRVRGRVVSAGRPGRESGVRRRRHCRARLCDSLNHIKVDAAVMICQRMASPCGAGCGCFKPFVRP